MTFKEWFQEKKKSFGHPLDNEGYADHAYRKQLTLEAWNAALDQSKEIIEDMDGCTDVQYCKKDGLKQIEELRL